YHDDDDQPDRELHRPERYESTHRATVPRRWGRRICRLGVGGAVFSGRGRADQPWHAGCTSEGVLIFALGLCVGVVLGTIIVGFLAVSAYDRGFDDALERRGDRIA